MAVVAALVVAPSAAAGTVDQEQPTWGTAVEVGGVEQEVAQTFMSARNGWLDGLELALSAGQFTWTPLRVAVRRTDPASGTPTDELGAEQVAAGTAEGPMAMRTVVLDPPVYVQADRRYAIVASTGADYRQPWFWGGAAGDPYASGSAFSRSGFLSSWQAGPAIDLAFRTFVAPGPDCLVRAVVNGRMACV